MEGKRVELTTFQPQSKEKKPKKTPKSFRFSLTLGESNAKICPEYNFTELIKSTKKDNNASFNESDPFGDLDDDAEVAAIAQRFEAKYGPKPNKSGKKRRTKEMDDFFDLGDGYDVDDPFIDNTEAYDEVVPSSLTTEHGGFYINKGKLDFKSTFEDSLEQVLSPKPPKKKKKNALDSDSEEEETGESLKKKFKAMKRKKLMEKKEMENKKKKKLTNGSDGEVLVKKKKKKNLEKLKMKKALSKSASSPVPPSAGTPATDVSTKASMASSVVDVNHVPTKPTMAVSVNDSQTTVKTVSPETKAELQAQAKGGNEVNSDVLVDDVVNKEDSSSRSAGEDKGENTPAIKNTPLPSQLPSQLAEAIDSIKKEAKERKEGKQKFFSDGVNKLLLNIELGASHLTSAARNAIFGHLGEHLPCGKNTILRRAKKLREDHIDSDVLREPLEKLREAVMKVMPALQEQHEAEVTKAKLEAKDGVVAVEGAKEDGSTESEGEEKADKKKKIIRGPRRKFQWTQEIRTLVCDLVAKKMGLFQTSRNRNESAEDFLRAYLDVEVKPIWPQGWMQTRTLFKQSKSAHEEWTKPVAKALPKPNKDAGLVRQRKLSSSQPGATPTSNASNNATVTPKMDTPSSRVSKTEQVIEISGAGKGAKVTNVVINLCDSEAESPVVPAPPSTMLSSGASSLSPLASAAGGGRFPSSGGMVQKVAGSPGGGRGLDNTSGVKRIVPEMLVGATGKTSWQARSQGNLPSPIPLSGSSTPRSSNVTTFEDFLKTSTPSSLGQQLRPSATVATQQQKSSMSFTTSYQNPSKDKLMQQQSRSGSASQLMKGVGSNVFSVAHTPPSIR